MAAIRDPSTADSQFTHHRTASSGIVPVDPWDVSYLSWESVGGALRPIRIRGLAARPSLDSGRFPRIVEAHGLGGHFDEDAARALAVLGGGFVLQPNGPGCGTTPDTTREGLPQLAPDGNGRRVFDTVPDVRGSRFRAHAVAPMRGLTCLQAHDDVDGSRLGMTGFSAGGVATLLSSGADDRIVAAVPLSATGAWDVAARSPSSWVADLLANSHLTTHSPEWRGLGDGLLAPAVMVGRSHAGVMMVDGGADGFFPLASMNATFDAIPSTDRRRSIAADHDHGCCTHATVEPAQSIQQRASLRTNGARRLWFRRRLAAGPQSACVPQPPVATISAVDADSLAFHAVVDPAASSCSVDNVYAWVSNDDGFTRGGLTMNGSGANRSIAPPFPLQPHTAWYVDVRCPTPGLVDPGKFSVGSPRRSHRTSRRACAT